jgi:hypothetical protein
VPDHSFPSLYHSKGTKPLHHNTASAVARGFIATCCHGAQTSDEHWEETLVSSVLVRFSGLAAIFGGVLGIVLTPILTYLWATYSDTYLYYGRVYLLVYLGCLLGLAGLYALRRGSRAHGES